MTPTQLRTFATIVRLGSSKAAATELDVSEAAVSGHVAALRRELGDELFRRTGSGIAFTPGGLRLATRAVEMLGLQDQTRSEVRAASAGHRVLRLAVSSLFGEYVAPGLIELFSKRAADLEVEMREHRTDQFAQLLTTRAVDAAIGPTTDGVPETVRSQEFLRFQLVAVVGAEHELAGARVTSADLAGRTWLLGPSAVDPASGTARMLRHYAVPEAKQRIFQSHAGALNSARRGTGVALCPAHMLADETADGRLTRVQAPGCMVDGTWATYVLRHDHPNVLARELVRFASTPRAIQAMLSGSGADIARFRPRVHVTLWS